VRPAPETGAPESRPPGKRGPAVLVAAVVLVAALGAFVASSSPDGLERVAADLGFADQERSSFHAPLADYTVPGLPQGLSGAAAGLLGAGLVGLLAWGAGRLLTRRRQP